MRRRAARVDANHGEIVEALEQVGATVWSLASEGKGCPDLLVGRGGHVYLIEVKDGSKCPSARRLTPDQRRWINWFNGDVHVVTSVEDAIRVVTKQGGVSA